MESLKYYLVELLIINTPAKNNVDCYGAGIGKKSQKDEIVQVKTLHKDPRVVCHDKVLPEAGH